MGKVYLVGAGPGDPGLLTVKGKGILSQCDVVVYDALVSQPILNLICPGAERIFAGKSRGAHTLPQEQITQVLIDKARSEAVVVRLKGGDPFMFGRGGEEMAALVDAGIEVEVVPGISSGMAAPAYTGIPLTHRDYSSSVLFVTGHEAVGKYRPQVNWSTVAQVAETLVIYMGIHNLEAITAGLLAGGKPGKTPVAVIRWGTTPLQTIKTLTLADLRAHYPELDLKPPAVVVVGAVVDLHHLLPSMQVADGMIWQRSADRN